VSLRICSRDMFSHLLCGVRHSERSRAIPVNCLAILSRDPSTPLRSAQDDERSSSGEDRNRTYPGSGYAEPTTVLKTARTTRHPSLSGLRIANCGLRKDYFAFLIAVTMPSKSGQSPVSSLEWSNLPLARISKAPPLEGINVSDLMRSPSSRILVAKLTAFGV
jgi:hypothetical protein